jgi:hypothetical protein
MSPLGVSRLLRLKASNGGVSVIMLMRNDFGVAQADTAIADGDAIAATVTAAAAATTAECLWGCY